MKLFLRTCLNILAKNRFSEYKIKTVDFKVFYRESPVPDENETKIYFLYLARHQRLKSDVKGEPKEVKEEPKGA